MILTTGVLPTVSVIFAYLLIVLTSGMHGNCTRGKSTAFVNNRLRRQPENKNSASHPCTARIGNRRQKRPSSRISARPSPCKQAKLSATQSPLNMAPEEFRVAGHQLVDRIADFFDSLPQRPVTTGESPSAIRQALGAERSLPSEGADAAGVARSRRRPALRSFPVSMRIRASGDTSPRRPRPSVHWANCSPQP